MLTSASTSTFANAHPSGLSFGNKQNDLFTLPEGYARQWSDGLRRKSSSEVMFSLLNKLRPLFRCKCRRDQEFTFQEKSRL